MKFSAFGQEIPCETIATRKVTVEPLIHTILVIFLLATLVRFEPARQRYLASQS